MLSRTIRFFTSAELAFRLGLRPKHAERKMRALGHSPWVWDERPHWAERDVLDAEARLGVASEPVLDADYSMRSRDVAAALGVSLKLLERLISRGLRAEIDRLKPGGEWRYARSTVERYLEKRERVRKEKLWRARDIAKHFGVSAQTVKSWMRGDSEHFPKAVLTLSGSEYFSPAEIKSYKRGLDAFKSQPTLGDLAEEVGVSQYRVSQWLKQGKLHDMEVRLHQRRIPAAQWNHAVRAAKSLSSQS